MQGLINQQQLPLLINIWMFVFWHIIGTAKIYPIIFYLHALFKNE